MKSALKIVLLVITINLCSCKKEIEYKYTDKEDLTNCTSKNEELIKEAVYVFEDYILKHYAFNNNNTLENAYYGYSKLLYNNRDPASEFFSEHLIEVTQTLKNENDLWIHNGNKTILNYKNEFVKCIIQSIQNQDLKKIFVVLTQSNSVKPEVLAPLLIENLNKIVSDKALTTYIALDMFYTKLFYMNSPEYEKKEAKRSNINITPDEINKENFISLDSLNKNNKLKK